MTIAVIDKVKDNSIADELGIVKGDKLISINGQEIGDIIDYYLQVADDSLDLLIEHNNGEQTLFCIEKDFDEDLGLSFLPATITPIMGCHNNCSFCFIAQMPPGLRTSLYIKDDDYRLSFLSGSYITGTNLNKKDIQRIIKYNLSPLYISVHQTDENRNKLLGRSKDFNIMNFLTELAEGGICFHTQIVLCPGINDGKVLLKTLDDLTKLLPNILSIAIVPVGLTKFRDNLMPLNEFTTQSANEVINLCNDYGSRLLKHYNKRVIYLADEFYIRAKQEFPESNYYEGYSQLENGIGMMRLFIDQFTNLLKKLENKISKLNFNKEIVIITGDIAHSYLNNLLQQIQILNSSFRYNVISISNKFFGSSITVAGLIVGSDIKTTLENYNYSNSVILIPENMLQFETDRFLDNLTVTELKQELQTDIQVVAVDGEKLLETIIDKGVIK